MSSRRDHLRQSCGTPTVNGWTIPTHGRCECKAPLYTADERDSGRCVECQSRAA